MDKSNERYRGTERSGQGDSREVRDGGRDNKLSNWVVIQLVEGLLGIEENLHSVPRPHKISIVEHACNPST